MIDVGSIEVAAAIVKLDDVFQGREASVMKVRRSQSDVAQTRRAKLAYVVRVARYLEAPGVFELRPHADVMKCVVGEKISRVTNVAP